MREPGSNHTFDMAEARIKGHIQRMGLYSDLIKALSSSADAETLDLYRVYIENESEAIQALVNWCWNQNFIDRFEAKNIIHWIKWFDFPEDCR